MAKIIRIGRGQNNDVFINDPAVSLNHCEISQDDNGEFRVTDLNSTNGTYVNDTMLLKPNTLLRSGDVVRIGTTTLPWLDYFLPPTPYPASYQQPYQRPVPPAPAPRVRSKNGMGTAGFVLSLLALVLCWIPVVDVILFLLGLAFSIVGVSLKNRKKGLAIAGLAISVVVLFIIFLVIASIGNGHYEISDIEDFFY
jgi:hypothetical protein